MKTGIRRKNPAQPPHFPAFVRPWNSDVLSNTDGCCQVIEAQRRAIETGLDG